MVLVPKVGLTVMYRIGMGDTNVSKRSAHPAIITNVWSPVCVNLVVMRDMMGPICMDSVMQSTKDSPHVVATLGPVGDDQHDPRSWFWPQWEEA